MVSGYKNKYHIQIHIFVIFRPIAFQWCTVCYGSDENHGCYKWCKISLFQVKPRLKSNPRMVTHCFRNEEIRPGHSAGLRVPFLVPLSTLAFQKKIQMVSRIFERYLLTQWKTLKGRCKKLLKLWISLVLYRQEICVGFALECYIIVAGINEFQQYFNAILSHCFSIQYTPKQLLTSALMVDT